MGKLFGVVIGIKDVICYKGHKVTAASAILKDFTSLYSATAVERLLSEDAIIIGSLNCDEFAMGSSNEHSVYGRVLNASDESRVPGGSSGGLPWLYRPAYVWSAWEVIQAVLLGSPQTIVVSLDSNPPTPDLTIWTDCLCVFI